MAGLNYIPADNEKDLSLTWFFDELPEEFRQVRKFTQQLEQEYLELRQLLKEAEDRLTDQKGNVELQARVTYLKKRISGLGKIFPGW